MLGSKPTIFGTFVIGLDCLPFRTQWTLITRSPISHARTHTCTCTHTLTLTLQWTLSIALQVRRLLAHKPSIPVPCVIPCPSPLALLVDHLSHDPFLSWARCHGLGLSASFMSRVSVVHTLLLRSRISYCLILPDSTPPYATSLSSLYPTLGLVLTRTALPVQCVVR